MYLDAHCHIERETFGDAVDDVVERARLAGVTELIAVGATRHLEGAKESRELAERHERVWTTAGVHPHDAAQVTQASFDYVEAALAHPRVVALGEVGLDYHYDNSPRDTQCEVFRTFLSMAKRHAVPVMLHTREAHADTLALIDEVGLSPRGGVVHCFTGDRAQARDYLDRGMYLSIPGVVTFKNADALRDAVTFAPLDRLFVETDSPYLTPIPHRGRKNEPAFVVHTAAAVARARGLEPEVVGEATRQNAMVFFRLPPAG